MTGNGDGDGFPVAAVLGTYRSLRIGVVILVLMLFVSVFIQVASAGWCLQSSISAYFFTDVHTVFIAVLCALGTLLLVYKGSSDTEDVLYDFAGLWAFVVATVPTGWPTNLGPDGGGRMRGLCGGPGLPLDYNAGHAIGNNVSSVVVGALLVLVASVSFASGAFGASWTPVGTLARIVGGIVTAVLAYTFVFTPHWFERHGHSLAAVAMFAFVILAIWADAVLSESDRYVLAYRIVGIVMLATLIAVLVLSATVEWTLFVLVAEAALILEFAAFWAIQTAELWNTVCRPSGHQELI
ncbi:hypothetical protein DK926_04450 [Rhodococcus sp. Eu-32]|uniref:hypothetical protein n=1 Tax=Rhodococcus sp. Eu-32 TaxID=1017319 RepID=UPI000DF3A0FD|nr:hypothetical protein [Rhodococcus sp. Eu-32]RRQ29140.1 hypothetical protein DK926_04450 [Rhodococcus sp. Eu-32]